MTTENQVKNVSIQQLSISYHKFEDRLFLRVGMSNGYEIVVWLTRCITKSLSEMLNKTPLTSTPVVADSKAQQSRQLAEEMTKNAVSQNLNFSTQYQQRKPMQQGQLFLVKEYRISNTPKNSMQLEFLCTNNQSIKLVLNDELLIGLTNMLQAATRQANWDLNLTDNPLISNQETRKQLLH